MNSILTDGACFIVAAAISHWVGPLLIKRMVRDYTDEFTSQDRGLPKAGLLIGRLERFLILLFVFSNSLTGVGFLLTAKSVFRFGDISDDETHRRTEYYLIGSLASFTLAISLGYIARLVSGLF